MSGTLSSIEDYMNGCDRDMNSNQLSISITKDGFLVNTYDNKMIMFKSSLQLIKYLQNTLTDKDLMELENTLFNVCKLKGMKGDIL